MFGVRMTVLMQSNVNTKKLANMLSFDVVIA